MALSELEGVLGHSFDREDVSTVGGLVLAEFGRVPRAGEAIDLQGYRLVGGAGGAAPRAAGRRATGSRRRRRSRAASGARRDLARDRGRTPGRGLRRDRRRRADHGEPGRAHPGGGPSAPRRCAVARLAGAGGRRSHRRLRHDVARRAARRCHAPGLLAGSGTGAWSCSSPWSACRSCCFAAYLVSTVAHAAAGAEVSRTGSCPMLRPWSPRARPAVAGAHRDPAHRSSLDLARGRGGRTPGRRRAGDGRAA